MTDGSIKFVYSYQAFDMQMLVLKEWEIHWPADIPSEEEHPNLRDKRDKHSLADVFMNTDYGKLCHNAFLREVLCFEMEYLDNI